MAPHTAVEKKCIYPLEGFSLNLKEQIQQVGFDVRVNKVFKNIGIAELFADGSKKLCKLEELQPQPDEKGRLVWTLTPGAYSVDMMEGANISQGHKGYLIHRSTLNRSHCFLTGSIYDPGFNGAIGGTLYVSNPLVLERGTRVGQFTFEQAEQSSLYNGSYQGQKGH